MGCDARDGISLDQKKAGVSAFAVLLPARRTLAILTWFGLFGRIESQGVGVGGGWPIGWSSMASRVDVGKRRVLGKDRGRMAGKKVLLYGNDSSAAANAIELYALRDMNTQFFWVIPKRLEPRNELLDLSEATNILSSTEVALAVQIYSQADSNTVVAMSAWGIEAIAERMGLLVSLQTSEESCRRMRGHIILHNLSVGQVTSCLLLGDKIQKPCQAEPHFYLLGDRSEWQRF